MSRTNFKNFILRKDATRSFEPIKKASPAPEGFTNGVENKYDVDQERHNKFQEQQIKFNEVITKHMAEQEKFNEVITKHIDNQEKFNIDMTNHMNKQEKFNGVVTKYMEEHP